MLNFSTVWTFKDEADRAESAAKLISNLDIAKLLPKCTYCVSSSLEITPIISVSYLKSRAVKVFHNPVAERREIASFLKGKSGVYLWLQKTNGKFYVGSSVDLRLRFYDYFSKSYFDKSGNTIIANAISKYGLDSFEYFVLEVTDKENVLTREQFYIDTLKPEYNILNVAGSTAGFKHTAETIEKISAAALGRVHFEDTKLKISESQKNNKNNPGLPLTVKDLSTGSVTQYSNLTEAAKELGFSRTTLSMGFKKSKNLPFIVKGKYEVTVMAK